MNELKFSVKFFSLELLRLGCETRGARGLKPKLLNFSISYFLNSNSPIYFFFQNPNFFFYLKVIAVHICFTSHPS